jgi:hypothetical protein
MLLKAQLGFQPAQLRLAASTMVMVDASTRTDTYAIA